MLEEIDSDLLYLRSRKEIQCYSEIGIGTDLCFLKRTELLSLVYGLRSDFSGGRSCGRLPGLITGTGLLAIPEAAGFESNNMILHLSELSWTVAAVMSILLQSSKRLLHIATFYQPSIDEN